MNSPLAERRRFRRIAFDAATRLMQDGRAWSVELCDISLKGLLVRRPPDWQGNPHQAFQACIELSADARLSLEVRLARSQNGQLGFRCTAIDLESICHLRRLVELNLGDERLMERELAALSGA
jgi:hypothetical protein